MYRVIKIDGTELGIVDSVTYIKFGSSGDYTVATEQDAIGVAFDSVPYNLVGHDEISEADTVVVSYVDAGKVIQEAASYAELAAAIREGVNSVD